MIFQHFKYSEIENKLFSTQKNQLDDEAQRTQAKGND